MIAFATFFAGQQALSAGHLNVALAHPGALRGVLAAGFYLALTAWVGLGLGTLIRHTDGGEENMHTPSPATGHPLPEWGRPRHPALAWSRRLMDTAPVAVIAIYGALWIALHAGGGRGSAHTLWQSLALAETVLALLLRGRKPASALAGILAAYLLFGLDPLLLPAVIFALCTVAAIRDHRTVSIAGVATAAALATMPYIHGETVSFTGYSLPRLAAAGAAVAAGTYLRVRWHGRAANRRRTSAAGHRRPGWSGPWARVVKLAARRRRTLPPPGGPPASPPAHCPADDPHQPPALVIIDLTHPQQLGHRLSLQGSPTPGKVPARANA